MSISGNSSFFIPVHGGQEEADDHNSEAEPNIYFPDSSSELGLGEGMDKGMEGTTMLDVFEKVIWLHASRDSAARNSVIVMNL